MRRKSQCLPKIRSARCVLCLVWISILSTLPSLAVTGTDYYNHVVFDNSITSDFYYYSSGRSVFPSSVELQSGALPVEKKIFFTAPNALRLQWRSVPGGSWETEVRVVSMRNRATDFRGDTLYLWCYTPEAIPAADLPFVQLEDEQNDFTVPVMLDGIVGDLPAKRWVQIRLPLSDFATASIHPFQSHALHSVYFGQSAADDTPHTLIIDEMKIDDKNAGTPVARKSGAFLQLRKISGPRAMTGTWTLPGTRWPMTICKAMQFTARWADRNFNPSGFKLRA